MKVRGVTCPQFAATSLPDTQRTLLGHRTLRLPFCDQRSGNTLSYCLVLQAHELKTNPFINTQTLHNLVRLQHICNSDNLRALIIPSVPFQLVTEFEFSSWFTPASVLPLLGNAAQHKEKYKLLMTPPRHWWWGWANCPLVLFKSAPLLELRGIFLEVSSVMDI